MEFAENLVKNLPNSLTINEKILPRCSKDSSKQPRDNCFLKNEAGELLKTKDEPKKRTENEPGHIVENNRDTKNYGSMYFTQG